MTASSFCDLGYQCILARDLTDAFVTYRPYPKPYRPFPTPLQRTACSPSLEPHVPRPIFSTGAASTHAHSSALYALMCPCCPHQHPALPQLRHATIRRPCAVPLQQPYSTPTVPLQYP